MSNQSLSVIPSFHIKYFQAKETKSIGLLGFHILGTVKPKLLDISRIEWK